ncbi:MAG TPA: hypothetical protein VGE95_17325, partial [Arthrobacter sp.]
TVDNQLTAAQDTLRTIQAKKGNNADAIKAQKLVVASLQTQLADIQKQIAAIDPTIGNGGCAA